MQRWFLLFTALSFCFLAIQFAPQGGDAAPEILHQVPTENTVTNTSQKSEDIVASTKTEKEPVEIKPCALPVPSTVLPPESREIFSAVLQELPCELLQSLQRFEVFSDPNLPRALAGRSVLKFREDILTKAEFSKVAIHELAHVIDLGGLTGTPDAGPSSFSDGSLPIFLDDPSVRFYQISWTDNATKKEQSALTDFVSGYAASDPFEDFAESLLFYLRQGTAFRQMAKENLAIRQKYTFFKKYVFRGVDFQTGAMNVALETRPWDITKL